MSMLPKTPEAPRGAKSEVYPGGENEPLVLLELIQRLKVRDVMTSKLVTVPRAAPSPASRSSRRALSGAGSARAAPAAHFRRRDKPRTLRRAAPRAFSAACS